MAILAALEAWDAEGGHGGKVSRRASGSDTTSSDSVGRVWCGPAPTSPPDDQLRLDVCSRFCLASALLLSAAALVAALLALQQVDLLTRPLGEAAAASGYTARAGYYSAPEGENPSDPAGYVFGSDTVLLDEDWDGGRSGTESSSPTTPSASAEGPEMTTSSSWSISPGSVGHAEIADGAVRQNHLQAASVHGWALDPSVAGAGLQLVEEVTLSDSFQEEAAGAEDNHGGVQLTDLVSPQGGALLNTNGSATSSTSTAPRALALNLNFIREAMGLGNVSDSSFSALSLRIDAALGVAVCALGCNVGCLEWCDMPYQLELIRSGPS